MGAWLKLFKDQTSERGSDLDIIKGNASWSRGRLDGIISVHLFEKSMCGSLSVPGTEWHQYDRYMAMLGAPKKNSSQRVARVVQAKIQPVHVGKRVSYSFAPGLFTVKLGSDGSQESTIPICQEHVGLWITMYIISLNFTAGIELCERGAFYGDKQIFKQRP